ncbi:MAG: membrane protein insertase YidC [SAR324 cluster bacterium]|nr:membrane protein insertase YidC [SAR324 cluster bacterium]
MIRAIFISLALLLPFGLLAEEKAAFGSKYIAQLQSNPSKFIASEIQEPFNFFGMAIYLNNIGLFVFDSKTDQLIPLEEEATLSQGQWFVAVGRFKVMLVKKSDLELTFTDGTLKFTNPEILGTSETIVHIASKRDLKQISPNLDKIRYSHLWAPIAWLAKLVEASLVGIQANIVSSWGITILVFTLMLKALFIPIGIMTVRFQRRVSQVKSILEPQLKEIKEKYDGEEAHNRLMAAHKEQGVSPFYTLKPLMASFIQIPFLIAIFNALGEMEQFVGQSFLWMEDLAYPDAIAHFSFSMPMFGSSLNLLPFIMTGVTLASTILFQNRQASAKEMSATKKNLYLMSAAFMILFYPFPAAMVFYWTLANLTQMIQQQVVKI